MLSAAACGQATTGASGAAHRALPSSPRASSPTTSAPTPSAEQSTAAQHATPPPDEDEHLTQPVALPACPHKTVSPHFATVQAMMRYLAAAWNRNDLDALCHVTNPNARSLLRDMHKEAVNLRLNHCVRQAYLISGYVCYLDHDFPAWRHKHGTGHAVFDAAPADRPGWFMTVFESCD
jgi:hypothetical protein